MIVVDTRRLTGANLLAREPVVVVELGLAPGEQLADVVALYREELARMREAHGMARDVAPIVRAYRGGAAIAYAGDPIDVLLACAEMSEWAALSAAERLADREPLAVEPKRGEIAAILAATRSPRLLALAAAAASRGLPLLWDDDEVSVGHGRGCRVYARGALPAVDEVPWEALGRVPIALVTGTNGKTTSTRLLARVAAEAGLTVGTTSTEGLFVGGEQRKTGDWTGPFAARAALRDPTVEIAILETARGGIFRRGLAVDVADAALVTNVSDDHLGTYGIDDLDAMTAVKAVVPRAVRAGGEVALGARSPHLVTLAGALAADVTLFADLEGDPGSGAESAVSAHRARGGRAVFTRGGAVHRARGEGEARLFDVTDAPITYGGAARHNVENLLGVVAAASGLGLSDDAILRAARGFRPEDNPGRGELYTRKEASFLLDFAHNPDGVRAIFRLVRELRGARPGPLVVIAGSAGDRTDHELDEMVRVIAGERPARVLLREMPEYLRGRAPGEVTSRMRAELVARGVPGGAIELAESEVAAVGAALADARPGDFVALLVHLDRAGVRALLTG